MPRERPDVNDPAKLVIGLNDAGQAEDLQRNAQGIAIIVDPRNDSHLLMAQMQVLFSKLHNRIVDWLREKGAPEQTIFTEAQRLVVWHDQWIILREFLPEVIGGRSARSRPELVPRVAAGVAPRIAVPSAGDVYDG